MVQEFWELFDYTDELAPYGINHSSDENEIAVNFNHMEEVAAAHRQRIPFTLTEIKKLLKNGNERRFIRQGTTRSAVSERHNRGKGICPECLRPSGAGYLVERNKKAPCAVPCVMRPDWLLINPASFASVLVRMN